MNGKRVTFTDVLRVREFRVIWLADAQSSIGDQFARVALAVLVFERTASALLTALTYALTFLPAVIGGTVLSSLADRVPRRRVMVGCDVARAVLFGGMAIPGAPLAVICVLLVLAVLTEAPFTAAEAALIPNILPDHDEYVVGTGLRTMTYQIAQLVGFAGGGLSIAVIGARQGLALDALTFAISGVLIMIGVRARPAARLAPEAGAPRQSSFVTSSKLIFGNPKLRTLACMAWLAGLYVVPEGVAAPYASAISHGATAVGFLMAAQPVGTAIGTYLFVRWVDAQVRPAWIAPLGVLAGVPLALCVFTPALPISLLLWMLGGLFFCYQVQVFTEFVRAVPDDQRGQAVGIASSGLQVAQGIGVLLGGWIAGAYGVGWAVGGAGVVGILLAAVLGLMWSRARDEVPGEPAEPAEGPTGAGPVELAEPIEMAETRIQPARRSVRRRLVNADVVQPQHRHRA